MTPLDTLEAIAEDIHAIFGPYAVIKVDVPDETEYVGRVTVTIDLHLIQTNPVLRPEAAAWLVEMTAQMMQRVADWGPAHTKSLRVNHIIGLVVYFTKQPHIRDMR